MLNVFIDANIYLRFYSYSDDAIDELEKFKNLIRTRQINLILTDQVQSEVHRNKESELARALDRFNKSGTLPEIPRFALHYEKAGDLREIFKTCLALKAELYNEIREQLDQGQLRADHIIIELFQIASSLRITSDHITRAERRRAVGNPPGKRDSLGDQVNWEALLDTIPVGQDLHLITADKDFNSNLFEGRPSFPLVHEWRTQKSAELHLFPSLRAFAAQHFPEIKLPSDPLKYDAIGRLHHSNSYAMTHLAIAGLEDAFDQITEEDAAILFAALCDNENVYGIAHDSDLHSFFSRLYVKYHGKTSRELDDRLWNRADYLADVSLELMIGEELPP